MFQVLRLRCVALSGPSMILVSIVLRYSDLFLNFCLGPVYGMACLTCVMVGCMDDIVFLSSTAFLCTFSLCPKVCPVWNVVFCLGG